MSEFAISTEKAIRELKALKPHLKGMSIVGDMAYDMAINALDKQIPRKIREEKGWTYCPMCKVLQSPFDMDQYCCRCGQRLDWGDE